MIAIWHDFTIIFLWEEISLLGAFFVVKFKILLHSLKMFNFYVVLAARSVTFIFHQCKQYWSMKHLTKNVLNCLPILLPVAIFFIQISHLSVHPKSCWHIVIVQICAIHRQSPFSKLMRTFERDPVLYHSPPRAVVVSQGSDIGFIVIPRPLRVAYTNSRHKACQQL